jgi:uncharacterized membrane protein YqaE (UPF0057 family)
MKTKILSMLAAVAVLSSCTNLRYTDYGRPTDFLKAKRDVVKPQGKGQVEHGVAVITPVTSKKESITPVHVQNEAAVLDVIVEENTSSVVLESIVAEAPVVNKKTAGKMTSAIAETNVNTLVTRPSVNKMGRKVFQKAFPMVGNNTTQTQDDVMFILALILAFLIPPLAVYLVDGVTSRFWLNLVLFLLGWGAFGWLGGIFWLCGLIAIVHALLIVLGEM